MSSVVLDPTERGPAQLASRVDPMDWFVLRQTALVPKPFSAYITREHALAPCSIQN